MSEKGKTSKARELCKIAIAAAILAVCGWIALPLGTVPVTLQTLGLCLIAGTLKAKRAFLATAAYLLLGFVGVPVFSGFRGGISVLFEPTGGYLISFLIAAPLIGLLCKGGFIQRALAMLLGMLVWYGFGILWLVLLLGKTVGVTTALLTCVLPFIPFDIAKICVAAYLSKRLEKTVGKMR